MIVRAQQCCALTGIAIHFALSSTQIKSEQKRNRQNDVTQKLHFVSVWQIAFQSNLPELNEILSSFFLYRINFLFACLKPIFSPPWPNASIGKVSRSMISSCKLRFAQRQTGKQIADTHNTIRAGVCRNGDIDKRLELGIHA